MYLDYIAISKPLFGASHSVINHYGIGLKSSNILWYQAREYNFGILWFSVCSHV